MTNQEFTATRTMLANAMATAGAELLEYMKTAGALAAIPNTDPQQYVVASALADIVKLLPAVEPTSPAVQAQAELTDDAIDEVWNSMPGGAEGWLKQFGYRQFARSIARHTLVRVAASMAGTIRPTDDELWEQTIGERDYYHDMADKLADAVAKHFGADIGEHSNMNCPWMEALYIIETADRFRSAAREQARNEALEDAIEEIARVGCEWIDDSNRAAVAPLLNEAIARIRNRMPEAPAASKEGDAK